jgi:hypothetical protein
MRVKVKSNNLISARSHKPAKVTVLMLLSDKFVCVVVKVKPGDAFVLTAYLTDKPKKGTVLWNTST